MSEIVITEVTIPDSVDAPDAADFIAAVEVRSAVNARDSGSRDDVQPPEEMLPGWRKQEFEPKRLFLARRDSRVVGRALADHVELVAQGDIAHLLTRMAPPTAFVAAVEHVPTGRLAGFTELRAPDDGGRPIDQEDTIVLIEHRGHRLGLWLKAANLLCVQRVRPGHPAIVTYNAEENRPMLDVNEALGFEPFVYEGAWRKDLTPMG